MNLLIGDVPVGKIKMTRTNQQTLGLNGASLALGFADPEELLWLVMSKERGPLPYMENGGNPLLIRFTMRHIQFIQKRLRNYDKKEKTKTHW